MDLQHRGHRRERRRRVAALPHAAPRTGAGCHRPIITPLALALAAALTCDLPSPPLTAATAARGDTAYAALYASGVTIDAFLATAERRKEQWRANYDKAAPADALVVRARATGGPWKVLVVAADGCSDSVNTVPYIARLLEKVMGAELRIVGSEAGRAIMDTHKTEDGRGATPTIVLLDAQFNERGCWIERPLALRSFLTAQQEKSGENGLFEAKMKWYDDDAGAGTLANIVEMLEYAAKGERYCK